jgi:hypothetical protein
VWEQLLIDATGLPLAVGLSAANTHDSQCWSTWSTPSRRSSGHEDGRGGHASDRPMKLLAPSAQSRSASLPGGFVV